MPLPKYAKGINFIPNSRLFETVFLAQEIAFFLYRSQAVYLTHRLAIVGSTDQSYKMTPKNTPLSNLKKKKFFFFLLNEKTSVRLMILFPTAMAVYNAYLSIALKHCSEKIKNQLLSKTLSRTIFVLRLDCSQGQFWHMLLHPPPRSSYALFLVVPCTITTAFVLIMPLSVTNLRPTSRKWYLEVWWPATLLFPLMLTRPRRSLLSAAPEYRSLSPLPSTSRTPHDESCSPHHKPSTSFSQCDNFRGQSPSPYPGRQLSMSPLNATAVSKPKRK